MAQFNFGVGQLALIPPGTNATPVNIGTLQGVSLDLSRDVKDLYGANYAPEDVALGKLKITGKAKTGRFNGALYNSLIAGSTIASGQTAAANNELGTVPGTPYQITAANSATWVADLGVYDYTASKWLTRVASAPATGQYSVSAGVYTFAAADTTHQVGLYYSYTIAATGYTTTLTNQLMGAATLYQVQVFNTYRGKQQGFKLYAVVFPKLSFADKNDDFRMTDLDFQAFTDSSGNVISVYTGE